ncbi:MAG: FkbM family methyltransferase [Desulfobulbaceae bacterium]|nr:FkbM family methyltransferase [Desulfobulbaceae bacterium]HIJ79556.1 FkbM family methyltransferase [Deltaproteobacteria bacterium]
MGKIWKKFKYRFTAKKLTSHDQKMAGFYGQFVGAGDLCFDVGANIGNRAKIFLALGADVVAVEPQKRCVEFLQAGFGCNPKLHIENLALGDKPGETEMMLSEEDTLSSLSNEWIESVRASGRFSQYSWNLRQKVEVSTLDLLIEKYGVPVFIKIDVEGFEENVVAGLSQQVKVISFEFVPEFIDATWKVLELLTQLGSYKVNFSKGESMDFELDKWVSKEELVNILKNMPHDLNLFGDVYVKFDD